MKRLGLLRFCFKCLQGNAMWGINLQFGVGRLCFVFKGLSEVIGGAGLDRSKVVGLRLGFVAFPGPEEGTWGTRRCSENSYSGFTVSQEFRGTPLILTVDLGGQDHIVHCELSGEIICKVRRGFLCENQRAWRFVVSQVFRPALRARTADETWGTRKNGNEGSCSPTLESKRRFKDGTPRGLLRGKS